MVIQKAVKPKLKTLEVAMMGLRSGRMRVEVGLLKLVR